MDYALLRTVAQEVKAILSRTRVEVKSRQDFCLHKVYVGVRKCPTDQAG